MTLHTYPDLEQGTAEWAAARCGIITASVIGRLITATAPGGIKYDCPECAAASGDPCVSKARKEPAPIKTLHPARVDIAAQHAATAPPILTIANNDTSRGLITTLAAERITGHVEPTPMTPAMWRGVEEEPLARQAYAEHHAPVTELGFMVRDDWGPRIGYSPDALVGDDGLIEIKSRAQKKQVQTVLADQVPPENMAQLQCGLLVSGRQWVDYVSYSGGMALWVKRVHPDPDWFTVIIAAARAFEDEADRIVTTYHHAAHGLPMTERVPDLIDQITF